MDVPSAVLWLVDSCMCVRCRPQFTNASVKETASSRVRLRGAGDGFVDLHGCGDRGVVHGGGHGGHRHRRSLHARRDRRAAGAADGLGRRSLRAGLRDEDTPRFYVTGLLGASFATLNDPLYQGFRDGSINSTVLTAGGAAGIAFEREDGRLRLEFEGRGRDDLMRLSATGSRWT